MPLRKRTIDLLALKPGDVVLDVGSGTGLSYDLLEQAIELAPNFTSAWFTLGEIRGQLKERDKAIALAVSTILPPYMTHTRSA